MNKQSFSTNKLLYRIGVPVSTIALIGAAFTGMTLADQSGEIIGNGNGSTNTIVQISTCTSSLTQTNKTKVNVDATVITNTGNNQASGNTGGDVTVGSGDADASLEVSVGGSSNTGEVPNCCECSGGSPTATISENGNKTNNSVTQTDLNSSNLTQKNKTRVRVRTTVKAKTGKNKANNNVGGTTDVTSGNADASLKVPVDPSSNSN